MSELYPVAILAGGLATRLRPHTDTIPKALLDINGEPFLGRQLRLLARSGVRQVVLCCGYLGEQMADFVGDGSAFGLAVQSSFDGEQLLGTGGAIRKALPLLGPRCFVLYGDSYLECDYPAIGAAFAASGRKAMMTVYRNENRFDRSNVEVAGGFIRAYDKRQRTPAMRHIDYGLGVFRCDAFTGLAEGAPADLAAIYQDLLAGGELAAYEVDRRFYEIGSPEGLEEFRAYMSGFAGQFLEEAARITELVDRAAVERLAEMLAETRENGGRLFILGVGGSAANASHAVNDFRKIAGMESYAPTDNIAELTARTNDEGWASVFERWLEGSRLRAGDAVLVLSVGGGDLERNVSPNLVRAVRYAKGAGARVLGIVGRDGGYTAAAADACVVVPVVNPDHVTPHTEAFQAVLLHLLVSHPRLKVAATRWESLR